MYIAFEYDNKQRKPKYGFSFSSSSIAGLNNMLAGTQVMCRVMKLENGQGRFVGSVYGQSANR